MHWRDEMQSLGPLAVETLRSVLTDEKASPSLRLRAALAVLDKISKPAPTQPDFAQDAERPMTSDEAHATLLGHAVLGHALPPETAAAYPVPEPAATSLCTTQNRAQSCTSAPNPAGDRTPNLRPAGPEPARNAPCPCGSGVKYKRCCSSPSEMAQAA